MDDFTFRTINPNRVPIVSINNQTVEANATNNISSAVSVSDADEDTISKYKVKDTAGANSFYISGNAVDATGVNGYEFASSALSTLSVKGDSSEGTQTLQIAAYDGTAWGDWTDFTVTTQGANRAPTLSVNVPTLSVGKWVQLGASGFGFTYNDADGDAATKYEVKTNSMVKLVPSNKNFYANGAVSYLLMR